VWSSLTYSERVTRDKGKLPRAASEEEIAFFFWQKTVPIDNGGSFPQSLVVFFMCKDDVPLFAYPTTRHQVFAFFSQEYKDFHEYFWWNRFHFFFLFFFAFFIKKYTGW